MRSEPSKVTSETLTHRRHTKPRPTTVVLATALAVASLPVLALPANAAVVEPPPLPFDITIFPERDFVSVAWNAAARPLTFDLTRNGVVIGRAASGQVSPALTTDASPEHILEVNHPGGLCWAGSTPDILPGDRLQVRESGAAADTGFAATTQNVTAQQAVASGSTGIVVRGTAFNADGSPMDLGLIEQRIINPAFVTDGIGKRDIRATSDGGSRGLITGSGGNWTATYTGLTAAQVRDAVAGETRGMAWQRTDAAGNRLGVTIYEAGLVGGPGFGGCPAAAVYSIFGPSSAVNASNIAAGLSLTGSSHDATSVTVTLNDSDPATPAATAAATPAAGSYSVAFNGTQLNGLRDGTLTATSSFVTPGGTIAGTGTSVLKDTVVPGAPTSDTPAGRYAAAQHVFLSLPTGEAASSVVRFTTDGSAPTASSQTGQPVVISNTKTLRAVVVDAAGNVGPAASFAYVIGAVAGTPGTGTPAGAKAPARPATPKATAGKARGPVTASVSWRAPSNGGSAIRGYVVRALRVNPRGAVLSTKKVTRPASARKLQVTLRAGKYRFTLQAVNAVGSGVQSARSNKVSAR